MARTECPSSPASSFASRGTGPTDLLQRRSRSLIVRSPSSCARRVLDLCGLSHLLDLRPGDTQPTSRTAAAIATWVAVPAVGRGGP